MNDKDLLHELTRVAVKLNTAIAILDKLVGELTGDTLTAVEVYRDGIELARQGDPDLAIPPLAGLIDVVVERIEADNLIQNAIGKPMVNFVANYYTDSRRPSPPLLVTIYSPSWAAAQRAVAEWKGVETSRVTKNATYPMIVFGSQESHFERLKDDLTDARFAVMRVTQDKYTVVFKDGTSIELMGTLSQIAELLTRYGVPVIDADGR